MAQDFANYIRMMKKKYAYVSEAKGMELAKDFLAQELKKAYEKAKSGVRILIRSNYSNFNPAQIINRIWKNTFKDGTAIPSSSNGNTDQLILGYELTSMTLDDAEKNGINWRELENVSELAKKDYCPKTLAREFAKANNNAGSKSFGGKSKKGSKSKKKRQ